MTYSGSPPQPRTAKHSQAEAKYDGPDKGPFRCGTCRFFEQPNYKGDGACRKVEGIVNRNGCCCEWAHLPAGVNPQ